MSGFLNGCEAGPDTLRCRLLGEFRRRILVMGTAFDGKVVGVVLTERDDPLVAEFPDLPLVGARGVLRVLLVDGEAGADPAELMRHELAAIVQGSWQSSRINCGGRIELFTGAQGGGYTLETLLGVAANAKKAPDRHGFEIKSLSGGRISLMTPTPDLGFQGTHNFREFMERFGHPAIDQGIVFYDPADTIYAENRAKVRPPWRINSSQLPQALALLYAEATTVTV